jgi:GTP cyclohydrolase I
MSENNETQANALDILTDAFTTVLKTIGEDVSRPGLMKTPTRAAKAILDFTQGYSETASGKTQFDYFFCNVKN